jgi:CRISPR system Cascade subunit CasA
VFAVAFLLTTEPWINVTAHGGAREIGLRDVLVHAHEYYAVEDPSPLVTLAVYRMLLAVLHRVFGPADLESWGDLYAKQQFDSAPIDAYLKSTQDRFDLVHAERPFFQVKGLKALYKPDGIGRLVFERSNYGAAVNVFQHQASNRRECDTLSFAQAARALLALQGFAPGGLVKKSGEPSSATAGPLNRGAFVLLRGRNLFETLLFNLNVYDPDGEKPVAGVRSRDLPSWEQDPIARPLGDKEPSRKPYGWVDWLTWQSRRLELALTKDGRNVSGVVYCVGRGLDSEGLSDPMLAYRLAKTRGAISIDLSEARSGWRDCHALIRSVDADGARAPQAVMQLARVEMKSVIAGRNHIPLDIYGMRGDQAAIKLTRHEQLSIPSTVLASPELVGKLREASQISEDVGRGLAFAVRLAVGEALAPGNDRDADPDAVREFAGCLGSDRAYWAALAAPFEIFLDRLGAGDAGALLAFAQCTRVAAEESLRAATEGLGTSARQLQGAAHAEISLRKTLREILSPLGGAT